MCKDTPNDNLQLHQDMRNRVGAEKIWQNISGPLVSWTTKGSGCFFPLYCPLKYGCQEENAFGGIHLFENHELARSIFKNTERGKNQIKK
jgi:hypothetical protein